MNSSFPSPRRALIRGIGGQDGTYLADLLIAKGYHAVGAAGLGPSDQKWKRLDLVETLDGVELQSRSLNHGSARRMLQQLQTGVSLGNSVVPASRGVV